MNVFENAVVLRAPVVYTDVSVSAPIYSHTDKRGTVWWKGDGPPPTTIPGSSVGDAYLDKLTGDLYWLEADVHELGG